MDINLAHRPEGATHAGKNEFGGSWYKRDELLLWWFIDMAEDGLPDRAWEAVDGNEPQYEPILLPAIPPLPPSLPSTGGLAFPCSGYERWAPEGGMTLRDYFAAGFAQAQATATSADSAFINPDLVWPRDGGETIAQHVARVSYALADAMIAARGGV